MKTIKILILISVCFMLDSCGSIRVRDNFQMDNNSEWSYLAESSFGEVKWDKYTYIKDSTKIEIEINVHHIRLLEGFPFITFIPLYIRENTNPVRFVISLKTYDTTINIHITNIKIITNDSIYYPYKTIPRRDTNYLAMPVPGQDTNYLAMPVPRPDTNYLAKPEPFVFNKNTKHNGINFHRDFYPINGEYYFRYKMKIQNYDSLRIQIDSVYTHGKYITITTPMLMRKRTLYYDIYFPAH